MKESIVPFANDAIKLIKEKFDLTDMENREDIPMFVYNGWCYYMYKSVANAKPEIKISRYNHRYYKDQPKGNRIHEQAWIYREGKNCRITGIDENGNWIHAPDHGFVIDGFSIQDYFKKAF